MRGGAPSCHGSRGSQIQERCQHSSCCAARRWRKSQPGAALPWGTGTRGIISVLPQNPSPQYLLFQVEGGLPVEALVLRLHVSEAREVVGIHEREVDLGR